MTHLEEDTLGYFPGYILHDQRTLEKQKFNASFKLSLKVLCFRFCVKLHLHLSI